MIILKTNNMKTTLNKIKEHTPCNDGWKILLTFLNKTEADDEDLDLLTILESNGLNDALWALRAVDGYEKEKRLMACDFAETVVHLTNNERRRNAIKVSRNFANGLATKEELATAATAASTAAYDYTDYTAYTAYAAASTAAYATYATTNYVSKENQIIIFKKYCI